MKYAVTFIILFFLLLKNNFAQNIIFEDNFNGNNSIPSLQARGWTIIDADGGGTSPTWFQGNINVFSALEGPDTGYVASNFNGRNDNDIIDHWLISPPFNLVAGDSLNFWARTASGSFDDSIEVYYSETPDPTISDFIKIEGFPYLSLNSFWEPYRIFIVGAGTYQFAIRYNMTNALTTADFIGIDLFRVYSVSAPPTLTTNPATNVTFNSATLNAAVNPNNSATDVLFEYGTTTAYGTQVTADQSPIPAGTNNVNVTATIIGLQANTVYHYRVNANNGGGTVTGADVTFTTASNQIYPSNFPLSHTYSFNDPTKQSSYRLIGLPGNQTTLISNIISGTVKKDWTAYLDTGADTLFLKEFDGTSNFSFSPGKGFWILSKNSFSVSGSVATVPLVAGSTFANIPLHSGFNIISNPFEKTVNWSDVQNLNGIADHLFDWTGVWNRNATQMESYKAYYFINVNNLTSLKIPYPFTIGKISKSKSVKDEILPDNSLKLSLMQNKEEKSYIVAGFNSSASKDYDKLDCFAPPGYFDEVRIHIEDQNLSFPYKQLFADFRREINEGQTFNLKIKNTTDKAVELTADGLKNFVNDEVYLFDENLHKFYNLKEQNEIEISTIHQNNNYQLLIGNENYINNIKREYIPIEYSLYQNYPNPFNPSTIIKYEIPNDGLVDLRVYNILGKEVAALVNEIQRAGIHEVEFSANGNSRRNETLSSGVYIYKLKSGEFISTKKMILIK